MPTRQTDSEYHRFLVEEILPSFDGVWKAPVTVHEVKGDLRLLAARVVIARQFESLRATYVLAATDLAHLAVAFIRHACDEYLWMLYLQHLTKEASNAVLVNMAYNDSFRGVLAARDFSSRDRMIRLGFGEDILDHVEEMIEETTNGFTHLGQRLGWPKKKQTPSTKWIAETVGEGALYDYLFSASSRAVHFSGHEVMRRGWVKEDDTLDVQDTGFRLYLSQLAIDVQIRLFLLTLKACGSLLGRRHGRNKKSPRWKTSAIGTSRQISYPTSCRLSFHPLKIDCQALSTTRPIKRRILRDDRYRSPD